MTTHAKQAAALLAEAVASFPPGSQEAAAYGVLAQAHATLALVEQQRAANLIAAYRNDFDGVNRYPTIHGMPQEERLEVERIIL